VLEVRARMAFRWSPELSGAPGAFLRADSWAVVLGLTELRSGHLSPLDVRKMENGSGERAPSTAPPILLSCVN
jgi:hypothetical protein